MKALLKRFDTRGIMAIQKLPDSVRPLMNAASFTGQPIITLGLCLAVIAIGIVRSDHFLQIAGLLALATILIGHVLKLVLRRTRPQTEYVRAMRFATFSFPSGHTLGATAAFGLLAIVATTDSGATNALLWTIDGLIITLVGVSRIYLGAHFPSDVIAGWLFGACGLLVVLNSGGML